MSLARLVVIEGPDAGREFELPLRGGAPWGAGTAAWSSSRTPACRGTTG